MNNNTELILIRITGLDRPGLTASITEILSKYDVTILDIGQADIQMCIRDSSKLSPKIVLKFLYPI